MRQILPCLATILALAFFPGTGPLSRAETPDARPELAALDALAAGVRRGQTEIAVDDMRFRPEVIRQMRASLAQAGGPAPQAASETPVTFWPNGTIYYNFASNVTALHQQAFLDAAAEWTAWAKLTFTPAGSGQANYVTVNDGGTALSGGNSYVGVKGGQQFLNVGATSWNRGTLCHEIGHVLGFIHEHQRSDRDAYVTILTQNATDGGANFVKLADSTNKGAYDFYSVMHYARNAFSVKPTPADPTLPDTSSDTIEPTAAYAQYLNVMGRETDRTLSKLDRAAVAGIYGAPTTAPGLTVTNTKDGGPGSLRSAIYYAFDRSVDSVGSTNAVTFHIPATDPGYSGGVFTIPLTSQLTAPGDGTVIDGGSQTAFTGDSNAAGPEIFLNGVGTLASEYLYAAGVRLRAANCLVKGLAIGNFNTQGILITGSAATGNAVQGCYVGTNAAGTAAAANAYAGVEINGGAHGNTVGGTTAAARNVISGNAAQGVYLHDSGTTGNVVQGNYVGTNAGGAAAVANAFSGVEIGLAAANNLLGGTAPGAGNVISGNKYQGVYVNGVGSQGNAVAGNYVGTNAAGTAALANGFVDAANHYFASGVEIYNAGSNVIGGTTGGARNILSGNAANGVTISGAGATANQVLGNYIGTNAAGTAAIANGAADVANNYRYPGVAIFGAAASNLIGSAATGAGNVISGNSAQGVNLYDSGTTGNVLAGNLIGLNAAGLAALANGYAGVSIFGAATGNTVGGTLPAARNVISGNGNQGVTISDAGTNSNVVAGNYVGLDATGISKVANTYGGVEIYGGAQSNQVGGTAPGARNFIAGNTNYGVAFSGSGTNANSISGNTIGLNVAGTAVSNGYQGVAIFGGAQNNAVGGRVAGAGNVISGNTASGGMAFYDGSSLNNSVNENAIYANGGSELNLYNGANASLPAPTLGQAVLGLNTAVSGTLNGMASNSAYLLEFFATPAGGTGGKVYIGSTTATTNSSGAATFTSIALTPKVPAGSLLVATATNAAGSSSAFSATRAVTTLDTDGDGMPDAYETAHGLNPNSAADASLDPDGDGLTNLQEYRAGTDPRDANSRLQITGLTRSGNDLTLGFPTVANGLYRLESTTDLTTAGSWRLWTGNVLGTGGTVAVPVSGGAVDSKRFFRVVVEP